MGNHLRKLIEERAAGKLMLVDPISDGLGERICSAFCSQANHAICFDLGDIQDLTEFQIIPEISRLPYSTCWFELDAGPYKFGALVWNVADDQQGVWFKTMGANWCLRGAFHGSPMHAMVRRRDLASGVETHKPKVSFLCGGDATLAREGEALRLAISKFLSAIHCVNVQQIEHRPSAALTRAREKRGKQPLFSYWTLTLPTASRPERCDLGGSHSSPRLHLRRGHPRQFAPGRYTWVKAHVVGSKHGFVHKDYDR